MLFSGTKISDISKASIFIILGGFIAVGGAFYLFYQLAEDVLEHEKFAVDQAAVNVVKYIQAPWLQNVAGWVTETGSVMWLSVGSVLLILLLFFFTKYSNWVPVYFIINMAGISALTKVMKLIFERKRPEVLAQYDGTGFSFPSGHSTGSMVFYGFIIYLIAISPLNKKTRYTINVLLGLYILLVGCSRVYLGVHYLTDILAGFSFGLAWLAICIASLEITMWNQRRTSAHKEMENTTLMDRRSE
ncbi:phosphatase PAP2 family protein [Halobacillus rhizosphaerae]|uniref:phosphatase PAP2 family protein n=1 Tax=Halobacillus rhizosphaerae TaxID=3064889 RepID=UPI00398A8A72